MHIASGEENLSVRFTGTAPNKGTIPGVSEVIFALA